MPLANLHLHIDADTVRLVRGADRAAFERMFRAHYVPLCDFVVRYVRSRDRRCDSLCSASRLAWSVPRESRTFSARCCSMCNPSIR